MPVLGPIAQRRPVESRLVAESVEPEHPPHEPPRGRSDGRVVQLCRRVQITRSRCAEEGPRGGDDEVAGLVAGGLRPLRRALHPHGVAQCRHLPHSRRPRRCGLGPDPLCAARQLAGQREHRQGAPPALANQAEVRPEDLVGRPDGADRQRRSGVDGVQDVRLRRRTRRRLGARARQLGVRGHVARRRPLQRRPPTRESLWRRADGPDLRESGRAERQPGSPRGREGYSRDVPPHGDERRGDGGAHCRRAYVRQDPRRGACGQACRPRTGGRQSRGAGVRLEGRLRNRQGSPRHHERPRGDLDDDAGQVEQRLLQTPVRVRVGADHESRWCEAVEAEERRR